MENQHVVVTFNLSDASLRSSFKSFLTDYLSEDLAQTFHGEVTDDELKAIKQKAGSIEYADDHTSDKIVVYEHDPLGIEKTAF